MSNDIITKTENIDKVVSTFAEKLGEYIQSMTAELERFQRAVENLGNGWDTDTYNNFRENMNNRRTVITGELKKAAEQKQYLDETAQKFHELLKILREASDE